MICPNCSFSNLKDSIFCQNCAAALKINAIKQTQLTKPPTPISENFNQVIFTPQKPRHTIRNVLLIFALTITAVVVIIAWIPKSDTASSTSINEDGGFPLNLLTVEDSKMEWQGPNLYIKGILKNNHEQPAHDISVRIDFYKDEATTKLFDTRFFGIAEVPGVGAYSFNELLQIWPEGKFWWITKIDKAYY